MRDNPTSWTADDEASRDTFKNDQGIITYRGSKMVEITIRIDAGDSTLWTAVLQPGDDITLPQCDIFSVNIDTI